jgi:2-polyprenyl-3-methyl-5-hydroxy-6-metoxy-1,4-benzoquinol methylase
MNNVHSLFLEQYTTFYQRVNNNIDPLALSAQDFQNIQLMYGSLIAALPVQSQVLDLGCGTGFLLNWLSKQPGIVPIGVDGSPSQVEVARRQLPETQVFCQDGLDYLREHPNTFAGIFCTDVLEHIPGKALCLEWVAAVVSALKPGGFFCCRVPNAANLTGSYCRYIDFTHERSFTSASLLQFLEVGGLSQCRILPIRAAHFSGRLRLQIEHLLHQLIFRICGQGKERIFTHNVCAVGFKL